jgi:hypothetical protein
MQQDLLRHYRHSPCPTAAFAGFYRRWWSGVLFGRQRDIGDGLVRFLVRQACPQGKILR